MTCLRRRYLAVMLIVVFALDDTASPFSRAVRNDDPRERMAELGNLGFMEFRVDEAAGLVRVLTLVWAG